MLLVFGPRSLTYDFGPGHPLTPRRFGPGIDLLRAVGAVPGLAPEPAPVAQLRWCHTKRYIDVVKRFSSDPFGPPAMGIGEGGDCPPFPGMHAASASVAGGSIRAVEAVLRGDAEHAQHPGGGLHHAMAERASGFCIYNDPALAIARARRDGLRVLYLDFDVHHGDGVQVLHAPDPGVLTFSIHETGRMLFPGTGDPDEIGEGTAAGTSVNVPLPPGTGEGGWLAGVRRLVPELAASFGPDLIVSQHGADSHAWDPLAHLNVTTTAMSEAARLTDALAHRHAGGRWLATGGGGYDAYRVVPRAWALTWLAGAHREVPDATPAAWRDRWGGEAARYGQAPLPTTFTDLPNAGLPLDRTATAIDANAIEIAELVRRALVPRLVREARDLGWWDPFDPAPTARAAPAAAADTDPVILPHVDRPTWARLHLAPRTIAPFDTDAAHALLAEGFADGVRISAAVVGSTVVALAVSRVVRAEARSDLVALGVAPDWRRRGLATRLLQAHVADPTMVGVEQTAEITVAERDVVEPLEHGVRVSIARRLLDGAGYAVTAGDPTVRLVDPRALRAVRPPTPPPA